MFSIQIRATIQPENFHEFLEALADMKDSSNVMSSAVFTKLNNSYELLYLKDFKDMEKLEDHLNCEIFKTFLGSLKVLGCIHRAFVTNNKKSKTLLIKSKTL